MKITDKTTTTKCYIVNVFIGHLPAVI